MALGPERVTTEDRIDAYYPVWVQVVSLVGIPALGLIALWLLTRPLWESGIGTKQFLSGAALGAAVLYQCAIGWRALPYMRVRMTASVRGLEIVSGNVRRTVAWSELALPKDYTFAGTTRLSLRSGEDIIFAFDNMKNVGIVKELIRGHHDASK